MNTRRKKAIADLGITLEECDSEDRDETYSNVAKALNTILREEEASRVKYVQESRNYKKTQATRDTYATYEIDSARCQRLISDAVELLRNHSLVDTVLETLLEITKKAPDAVSTVAPPAKEPVEGAWQRDYKEPPKPGISNRPEDYGQTMNMDLGNHPQAYGLSRQKYYKLIGREYSAKPRKL